MVNEIEICLSLHSLRLEPAETFELTADHHAIWVESGRARLNEQRLGAGEGIYCPGNISLHADGDQPLRLLHFCLASTRQAAVLSAQCQLLAAQRLSIDPLDAMLRLDKVTFPAGATAWRHVHPGPGIRCLTRGTLAIHSDHSISPMRPGDAWFEAANHPVRAVASETEVSEFVRVMILPKAYEGQSSLKLLDPQDAAKPRLQTNQRFFDKLLAQA